MKKPPEYASCAKCGYRGIAGPSHECTPERAAIAHAVEQHGPRRDGTVTFTRRADAHPVGRLTAVVEMVSNLTGRRISLEDRVGGLIEILQRCRVCGDVLATKISSAALEAMGPELQARISDTIVKAYLLHRCAAVGRSLLSFTYEELYQLKASLERDATTMLERCAEIEKLEKARAG